MLDAESRIRKVGHIKGIVTQSGSGNSLGGGHAICPRSYRHDLYRNDRIGASRDIDGFEVENQYRDAVANLPGARAEVVTIEEGPPVGKAIQLELSGDDLEVLFAESTRIRNYMENSMEGLIDVDDTAPVPGIEWEIVVDRARAAMSGANMTEIGTAIQLMTNGVFMGDYRPSDSEEEVDIRVRYPAEYRGLEQMDTIRINTANGDLVPISSFVTRVAKPAVSAIQRVDGERVVYVRANAAPGLVADNKVSELEIYMEQNPPVHVA